MQLEGQRTTTTKSNELDVVADNLSGSFLCSSSVFRKAESLFRPDSMKVGLSLGS
jgi:hypothetical protein